MELQVQTSNCEKRFPARFGEGSHDFDDFVAYSSRLATIR